MSGDFVSPGRGPAERQPWLLLGLVLGFLCIATVQAVPTDTGVLSREDASRFLHGSAGNRELDAICWTWNYRRVDYGGGAYWAESWCAEEMREGLSSEERSECFRGYCMQCESGSWRNGEDCQYCSAGRYRSYRTNVRGANCETCARSSYQPYTGQTYCYSCPTYSSHSIYGSTRVEDCLCQTGRYMVSGSCQLAPAGYYSPNANNNIYACPVGQYQDALGQGSCKLCPEHSTTSGTGAASAYDCECETGYVMLDGECEEEDPCANQPCGDYQCVITQPGSYQCQKNLRVDVGYDICNLETIETKIRTGLVSSSKTTGNPSVSPSTMEVNVAEGDTYDFQINVNLDDDQLLENLDVYFLQEASYSMQDDINTMRWFNMPYMMWNRLRLRASSLRMGLGSFVDKPVHPYGFHSDLSFAWAGYMPTSYVFRNWLSVSDASSYWNLYSAYSGMYTTADADHENAQLEALYQVAKRADATGCDSNPNDPYGNVCMRSDARRLVFVMTDSPYHEAGDAGHLNPFTGEHAGQTWFPNTACVGCSSPAGSQEDYPSKDQVRQALLEANIYPIFLTFGQVATYEALTREWGFGTVRELAWNSNNFASAVIEAQAHAERDHVVAIVDDPEGFVESLYLEGETSPANAHITRFVSWRLFRANQFLMRTFWGHTFLGHWVSDYLGYLSARYAEDDGAIFRARLASRGQDSGSVRLAYVGSHFIDIDVNSGSTIRYCERDTVGYTPTFHTIGNVAATSNSVQFSRSGSRLGAAWVNELFPFVDGMKISFDFYATGSSEGFAFVLHRHDKEGLNALRGDNHMGFKIKKAIAVEFDMLKDTQRDPDDSHVAIMSRYRKKASASHRHQLAAVTDIRSPSKLLGHNYHVEIEYLSCPRMLIVYMYNGEDLVSGFPLKTEVSRNYFPFFYDNNYMPGHAYIGFTFAGGSGASTSITNLKIDRATPDGENSVVGDFPTLLNGGIDKFLIAGPYARTDGTRCGCDVNHDAIEINTESPVMPYEGMRSAGKEWVVADGYQPNLKTLGYGDLSEVFAAFYLYSPDDRTVVASVGPDDGLKLWVNHQYYQLTNGYGAISENGCHPPGEDYYWGNVNLHQGWNTVIYKVANRWGRFATTIRFVDSAWRPVTDMRFSLHPPETAADQTIRGTAGANTYFTIQARDRCEHSSIRGSGMDFGVVRLENDEESIPCTTTFDAYRYFYSVSCPTEKADTYQVQSDIGCPHHTMYGDEGECVTVTVKGQGIYAANTEVTAPSSITAGDAVVVYMTPYDKNGYPVDPNHNDASLFRVTATRGSTSYVSSVNPDFDDGRYTATFSAGMLTAADKYTLTASYDGEQFYSNTGFRVNPGSTATYDVSGVPSSVQAGVYFGVELRAYDAYGNSADGSISTVTGTSSPHSCSSGCDASWTFSHLGTGYWKGSLRATLIENNDVIVQTNTGLSWTSVTYVQPAAYDATQSYTSLSAATLSAGDAFSFQVTSIDIFGNRRLGESNAKLFRVDGVSCQSPVALGDGQYRFSCSETQAGTYTAQVKDQYGVSIGSSATMTYNSASMFGEGSVTGSGGYFITAGDSITFNAFAYDVYGNPVNLDDATAARFSVCASIGCQNMTPAGGNEARATMQFTSTTQEVATLKVDDVDQGRYQVSVQSALAAPGSCTVGAFDTPINAGDQSTVELTIYDEYGNLVPEARDSITASRLTFSFAKDGAPLDSTAATLVDVVPCEGSSGCYFARFRTTVAGDLELQVLLDSAPMQMAQTSLHVSPLPTQGSASSVTATPASMNAGVSATIDVLARDKYGNAQEGTSDTWAVTSNIDPAATYSVSALGAGQYRMTVTTFVSGSHSLRIRHLASESNVPISAIYTYPGAISGADCSISSSPSSVVAGNDLVVSIAARDAYGNVYDVTAAAGAASDFSITLDWDDISGPDTSAVAYADATAGVAASATVTYSGFITVSGFYGSQEFGAPVRVRVDAAEATTVNWVSHSSTLVANQAGSFVVQVFDTYGNLRPNGGDAVLFVADGSERASASQDSAQYSLSYTTTLAHTYTVIPRVNGNDYSSVDVVVGPASLSSASAVVSYETTIFAGTESVIDVEARDAWDNKIDAELGIFALTIPGVTFTASEEITTDSLYRFRVTTSTTSPSTTITVYYSGGVLADQPAIVCDAGAVNYALSTATSGTSVAGVSTAAIQISLRDDDGNLRSLSDDSASLSVVTDAVAVSGPTFTATGTGGVYDVTASFETAGDFDMEFRFNGVAFDTQVWTVTPAASDATTSSVTAPGTYTAGAQGQLMVQLRDEFGNNQAYSTEGSLLSVSVTDSSDTTTVATISCVGDCYLSAGAYYATFRATLSGPYVVTATYNGASVAADAFTMSPAAISAGMTVIPSSSSATAGIESSFQITARDAYGNVREGVDGSDSDFAVSLTETGATSAVTFNGDGVYTVSYMTEVSGTHTLSLTHSSSSAGSVRVDASAADVSASVTAVTDPAASSMAGSPVTYVVSVQDAFGNTIEFDRLATEADKFDVTVSGMTPLGKGWYLTDTLNLMFSYTLMGDYSVTVTYDGALVGTYPLEITPSSTYYAKTVVSGLPADLTAGHDVFDLTVESYDIYNNPTSYDDDVFALAITGSEAHSGRSSFVSAGTHTIAFPSLTTKGTYTATVYYGDKTVYTGETSVLFGSPDATMCKVGVASWSTTAGVDYSFSIYAYDEWGNRVESDGVNFSVDLPSQVYTDVTYVSSNEYVATIRRELKGDSTITVLLDTDTVTTIAGTVEPADISAATTLVSVTESDVVAGVPSTAVITARDEFNNELDDSSAAEAAGFVAKMEAAGKSPVPARIAHNAGTGTYTISYNMTVATTYSIGLTYSATSVPNTASVTVHPANAAASRCTAQGNGLSGGLINRDLTFTVISRDIFGNLRMEGDDDFSVASLVLPVLQDAASVLTSYDVFRWPDNPARYNVTYNFDLHCESEEVCDLYRELFMGVELNGVDISGSPFSMEFDTDAEAGAPSEAIPDTDADTTLCVAGETCTFKIHARTEDGSLLLNNLQKFTVQFDGGDINHVCSVSDTAPTSGDRSTPGCTIKALDAGDEGVYQVIYRVDTAGDYDLYVSTKGIGIQICEDAAGLVCAESPRALTIAPAQIDAAHCTWTNDDTLNAVAGVAEGFQVQARDRFDNDCPVPEDTYFGVSVDCPNGDTQPVPTCDNAAGLCDAEVTCTTTGSWGISVTYEAQTVNSVAYPMEVTPAPTSAAHCDYDAVATSVAGEVVTYSITARDEFGNLRGESSKSEAAKFRIALTNSAPAEGPAVSVVAGVVYDAESPGVYEASYTPTIKGTYQQVLNFTNTIVSLIDTEVTPAAPVAVETFPTGLGDGFVLVASSSVDFSIQSADEFGNTMEARDDTGSFSIGVSCTSPDDTPFEKTSSVSANANVLTLGTYDATFDGTLAGDCTVTVTFDSTDIQSTPFSGTIIPDATSAEDSRLLSIPGSTVAGEQAQFTLRVKDQYGNLRLQSSAEELSSISAVIVSGEETVETNATDTSGNGDYTLTYTPTIVGTYSITVYIDGAQVDSATSYETTVTHASALGSNSIITDTASGLSTDVPVNTTVEFTIQARDRFGNLATTENDVGDWVVALSASTIQSLAVVSEGNGLFTVSYTSHLAGSQLLIVYHSPSGTSGASGPYEVLFSPGPIYLDNSVVTMSTTSLVAGQNAFVYMVTYDVYGNLRWTSSSEEASQFEYVLTDSTPTEHVRCSDCWSADSVGGFYADGQLTLVETYEATIEHSSSASPLAAGSFSVSPAETVASTSTVAGFPSDGVAGESYTFTVEPKDEYDNSRQTGSSTEAKAFKAVLTHQVDPSEVVTGNVSYTEGASVYDVKFMATLKGTYDAEVTFDGDVVDSFVFVLTHAATDPAHTVVTLPADFEDIEATESRTFTFTAFDRFDNQIDNGDDAFTSTLPGANVTATDASGNYQVEFVTEEATTHEVDVTLGGVHITGSPFRAVVVPTTADPDTSSLEIDSLDNLIAGHERTVTITVRDRFNNVRLTSDDTADMQVWYEGNGPQYFADVVREGDGVYTATRSLTVAGDYDLIATLDGSDFADIVGKAFTVVSAKTNAANCVVDGDGLTTAVAGEFGAFTIQAFDQYDNVQREHSDEAWSVTSDVDPQIKVSIVFNGNGLYTVTYNTTLAADHSLTILHTSGEVPNTNTLTVDPNVVDEGQTSVDDAPDVVIAGDVIEFTITPRDRFRNRVYSDDTDFLARFTSQIVDLEDASQDVALSSNTDLGLFDASITLVTTGVYTLNTRLDGSVFDTRSLVVEPAATHPGTSNLILLPTQPIIAGEVNYFILVARDEYGNERGVTSEEELATINADLGPAASTNITDAGDGNYEIFYTITQQGTYTIVVTISDEEVATTGEQVTVHPAAVSTANVVLSGDGLQASGNVAGVTASFTLESRDRFDNVRTTDVDSAEWTVVMDVGDATVTSVGNGVFNVDLDTEKAGSQLITVEHVTSGMMPLSPYTVDFTPNVIDVERCTITDVPSLVIAGVDFGYTLHAYDSFDNHRRDSEAEESAKLSVVISHEDGELVEAGAVTPSSENNGDFDVSVYLTVAGVWTAQAFYDGASFTNGTASLTHDIVIGPAATVASETRAREIDGVVVAGDESIFYIDVYDEFGNYRYVNSEEEAALLSVEFVEDAVGGEAYATEELVIQPAEDGTYVVSYVQTFATDYILEIAFDGDMIGYGQYDATIEPAPTHAPSCVVTGVADGWTLIAGRTMDVQVKSYDRYLNERPGSADAFFFEAVGNFSSGGFLGEAQDNGVYTVEFVETLATSHVLLITLLNPDASMVNETVVTALDGIVTPAEPNMATSAFRGFDDIAPYVAGTFLESADIIIRDVFNNVIPDATVEIDLAYTSDDSVSDAIQEYALLPGRAAHSLAPQFRPVTTGWYEFGVRVLGWDDEYTHIDNTPVQFQVYPGPTDASQSYAFGPHTETVFAGFQADFEIQARDEYGNDRIYMELQIAERVQQTVATTDEEGQPIQATDAAGAPLFDEDGEPVYVEEPLFDDHGDPVYEYVQDDEGNYVFVDYVVEPDVEFEAYARGGENTDEDYIEVTVEGSVDADANGRYEAFYQPHLVGDFSLRVTVMDGAEISGSPYNLTVMHVVCKDLAAPYRHPDGECHSEWQITVCESHMCESGECVDSLEDCPCPEGTSRCGDGRCASFCPTNNYIQCDSPVQCWDGSCRNSEADCPTPVMCPPGHFLCADGATCVYEESMCPATPSDYAQCPPDLPFLCQSGICVDIGESCPTPVTCGEGMVACFDGSCRDSHTECPTTGPPPLTCYSPTPYMCPDGTCRAVASDCPSQITCPKGYAKCPDSSCVASASECTYDQDGYDKCPTDKHRCADGSCRDHPYQCPTPVTCPAHRPVKCWDGTCSRSVYDCTLFSSLDEICYVTDGLGEVIETKRCPDGTCGVENEADECPTRRTCPTDAPVLCPNGQCVFTAGECEEQDSCPSATPYRCPSGDCRSNLVDCPRTHTCPEERSVRCFDGTCARTVQECEAVISCVAALDNEDAVRCPDGTCALDSSFCPTERACKVGEVKCWDGSCRSSMSKCPSISSSKSCPAELPYRCADRSCALSAYECPTHRVCPSDLPVRCDDNSCAETLASCAASSHCDTKYFCPSGECILAGYGDECGTGITCPPELPYICWDNTCRASLAECPAEKSCEGEFQCPDGSCKGSRLECTSEYYETCPDNNPVRCPEGTCVASSTECTTSYVCPEGKTMCNDGSCRIDACEAATCPLTLPVVCESGTCAATEDACPIANGCTVGNPTKCNDGGCYPEGAACPTVDPVECTGNLTVYCESDNTCRESLDQCVLENGCPESTPTLCANGLCIEGELSDCDAALLDCPSTSPYKCLNGICTTKLSECPVIVIDDSTACYVTLEDGSEVIGFPCADGTCTLEATCTAIPPCSDTASVRCGDGTCRASEEYCPATNTCPANLPVRCQNGMCVASQDACLTSTGCPESHPDRCDNGLCVVNATSNPEDCVIPGFTSSGCPTNSSYKCWDDSCAESEQACPSYTLCPSSTAFRCPDGTCVGSVEECEDDAAMTPSASASARRLSQTAVDDDKPTVPTSQLLPESGDDLSGEKMENGCPVEMPVKCWYGDCVQDESECMMANGCSSDNPVRCPDGSCKKYAYTHPSNDMSNTCMPRTVCGEGQVKCADGSCKGSFSECPVVMPCPASKPVSCPAACSHLSVHTTCCVASDEECDAASETTVTTYGGCPVHTPVLCSDTSTCVAHASECVSKTRCVTQEAPYWCSIDNKCKASAEACKALRTGECGGYLCPTGECVQDSNLCPTVGMCPTAMPKRCSDGSCVGAFDECPEFDCAEGFESCPDGTCSATGCLDYDGCPVGQVMCPDLSCRSSFEFCGGDCASGLYRCYDSSCVADPGECPLPARSAHVSRSVVTIPLDRTFSLPLLDRDTSTRRGSVLVNVGALAAKDRSPLSVEFEAVADSVYNNVVVPIPEDRRTFDFFGGVSELTASQAVLSAVFRVAPQTASESIFYADLVTALLADMPAEEDLTMDDICLAFLNEDSEWECDSDVTYSDGTATGSMSGFGTYAIVVVPETNVEEPSGEPGAEDSDDAGPNTSIVGGVVGGIGGSLLISGFVAVRLRRYRSKLHDKRRLLQESGDLDEDPLQIQMNPMHQLEISNLNSRIAEVDREVESLRGQNDALVAEREASRSGNSFSHQFEDQVTNLSVEKARLQSELARLKAEAGQSAV